MPFEPIQNTALLDQQVEDARLIGGTSNNALRDAVLTAKIKREQEQQDSLEGARELNRRKEQHEQSLIGKAGLDDDSVLGGTLNKATSFASATSRLVGELSSLPSTVGANAQLNQTSDVAREAYDRYSAGTATPEDMALLNTQVNGTGGRSGNASKPTNLEAIENALNLTQVSTDIRERMDISNLVSQRGRAEFSDDLAENTKRGVDRLKDVTASMEEGEVSAVADFVLGTADVLVNGLATGVTDPSVMGEYVAEMVPQLIAGATSKTALIAANAGYGADQFAQGIKNYQEANDGKLPSRAEQKYMAINALGASVADALGEAKLLGKFNKASKVTDTANKSETKLRKALNATKPAQRITSDAATEGGTEGLQTYLEGEAKAQSASIEEIVEGATIGGVVGGGISTARATAQGAKKLKERAAKTSDEIIERNVPVREVKDKTKTVLDEATSNEQRKKVNDEITQTSSQIRDELSRLEVEDLSALQASLAQTKKIAEGVTDPKQLETLNKIITGIEERIAGVQELSTPKEVKRRKDLREQLQKIEALEAKAKGKEQISTVEELDQRIEASTDADETANLEKTKAQTQVRFAMEDPLAVSDEQLNELASSEHLTADEKSYVTAVKATRELGKKLESGSAVHKAVLLGAPRDGWKGLTNYLKSASAAVRLNNKAQLKSEIDGLKPFAISHKNKQNAVKEAYNRFNSTGEPNFVYREEGGKWTVSSDPTIWTATVGRVPKIGERIPTLNTPGHVFIDSRAKGLNALLGTEVEAITATMKQLRLMDKAIGKPAPKVEEVVEKGETEAKKAPEQQTQPTKKEETAKEAVETEAEVTATAEPEQKSDTEATLTSLRDKQESERVEVNNENYLKTNVVRNFVKQVANDTKPLTQIKDVLSQLATTPEVFNDFSPKFAALNALQIKKFTQAVTTIGTEISKGFKKKLTHINALENDYVNYLRFDVDSDGVITENVTDQNLITAMSVAVGTYLAETSNSPEKRTNDEIKTILGMDADQTLPVNTGNTLRNITDRAAIVETRVGRIAMDLLGLKLDNAPESVESRLALSLGTHALSAAARAGTIKYVAYGIDVDNNYQIVKPVKFTKGNRHASKAAEQQRFIVVTGKKSPITAALTTANSAVFDAFGATVDKGMPLPDPQKSETEQIRRTNATAPKAILDAVESLGNTAFEMHPAMTGVLNGLSNEALFRLFDGKRFDPEKVLNSNLTEYQAQAEATQRQIDSLKEYNDVLTDTGESKFYFTPVVYKQQRVGFKQARVNPLQNKPQRFFMRVQAWENDVDLLDGSSESNLNFKYALAQAFGIGIDKQNPEASIAELDGLRSTREFKAAVQLATSLSNGDKLSTDNETWLMNYIEESLEEGAHSFLGLVEAGKALEHVSDPLTKNTSFKTSLFTEVDGTSNGPAMATLLLGGLTPEAYEAFGRQVGLYTDTEENALSFANEAANLDIYQELAAEVKTSIRHRVESAPELRKGYEAIGKYYPLGYEADETPVSGKQRKPIKVVFTSLHFGSSFYSADQKEGVSVAEKITESVEETLGITNPVEQRAALTHIMRDVYRIVETGYDQQYVHQLNKGNTDQANYAEKAKAPALREIARIAESIKNGTYNVRNFSLPDSVLNGVGYAYSRLIGDGVTATLKDKYGETFEARDRALQAASTASTIYTAARKAMVEHKLEELIASGELPSKIKNGKDVPATSLPPKHEAEIDKHLRSLHPSLATISSNKASNKGEKLGTGIELLKRKQSFAQGDFTGTAHQNRAGFAVDTPVGGDAVRKQVKSLNSKALLNEDAPIELGAVIMPIHAIESHIASQVYSKFKVLHLNDAAGFGVKDVQKGGQQFNEAFIDSLTSYDLMTEMSEALQRTINGLDKLALDPVIQTKVLEAVAKALEENKRLGYVIAPTKLVPALQKYNDKFKTFASETNKQKLEYLSKVKQVQHFAAPGTQFSVTPEKTAELELDQKIESADHRATYRDTWGEEGVPKFKSDPVVEETIKESKTARELVNSLLTKLPSSATSNKERFVRTMLEQLSKAVPETTKVRYVTPANIPKGETGLKNARGWYDLETDTVYIKSSDFVSSGITHELVAHELLHAATANRIESEPNSPEVRALSELLEKARERVESSSEFTHHRKSVSSIHELVAWGLTNKRFQDEILKPIRFKPKNVGQRKLTDGLRAFVNTLKSILWTHSDNRNDHYNGLNQLVTNSSYLFKRDTAELNKHTPKRFAMANGNPATYTTAQIFESLSGDPASKRRLQDVLRKVVNAAYGTTGQDKPLSEIRTGVTPEDTFLNAVANNQVDVLNQVLPTLGLTQQEQFVAEGVAEVVNVALDSSPTIQRSLSKVYEKAKATLSPADLPPGVHAKIFSPITTTRGGKSDYLNKFVALALTYPELRQKLEDIDVTNNTVVPDTLLGRVQNVFNRLMEAFRNWVSGTGNETKALKQVELMASKLAHIENKRKAALVTQQASRVKQVEESLEAAGQAVKNKVADVLGSDAFKNHSNTWVRAGTRLARMSLGNNADTLVTEVLKFRDKMFTERRGLMAKILTEMRGATTDNAPVFILQRMLRAFEHDKESLRHGMTTQTKNAYEALSNEESAAITRALLRTDLPSLDNYTERELADFMADRSNSKVSAAIDFHIDELVRLNPKFANYYQSAAKDLGLKLATGKAASKLVHKNATNIAELIGLDTVTNTVPTNTHELIPHIDAIASLYAIKRLDTPTRNTVATVMNRELDREGLNGIQFTLATYRQLKADALENTFNGNPRLMEKGYIVKITDPMTETISVLTEEVSTMELLGYEMVSRLPFDSDDPAKVQKVLMKRTGGAMRPIVQGLMNYVGKHAKGSGLRSRSNLLIEFESNVETLNHARRKATSELTGRDRNYEPDGTGGSTFLQPVTDEHGSIVDWRYEMEHKTREDIFAQDLRVENVLGAQIASTLDKAKATDNNREVAQALKDQYDEDFTENPERYVLVSDDSQDGQISEMWELVPEETKRAFQEVWGSNSLYVRQDLVDMIFGYRKRSVSELVHSRDEVHTASALLARLLIGLGSQGKDYSEATDAEVVKKLVAEFRIQRVEDVWQQIVKEVKDIWIIKNLVTLVGNTMSNATLLAWQGVPMSKIIGGQAKALKNVLDYQKDHERLVELEHLRKSELDLTQETRDEVFRLKDRLARNPVKPLIDAGLMQSIVEDVDTEEDVYTYKSRLTRWVDSKTQAVPDAVKEGAKWAYLAHGTPGYKVLNRATQLSDFLSRAVLYDHLLKEGVSAEDAIQRSDDAFVNYDLPTDSRIQYLNDMGIIPFTKYYMRIQKTLFRLFQEKPARALSLVVAANMLPGMATALDATLDNKAGNLLVGGAFEYPDALSEIITIKAGLNML